MTQKTSAAISKWLQKQDWYESYVENLERYRDYDSEGIKRFLNGCMYDETIIVAFPWYLSPEGYDYWREINNEFAEWYYGEN